MLRFSLLVLLVLCVPARAQVRPVEEPEEPGARTQADEGRAYDELIARFQTDYFRVTTLVQVVPSVPFEDSEGSEAGFDVPAAWLGIGGRLGEGIGYFVRGAFEREPTLLEAYVSYGSDSVRGIVGRQKVPFSAEFLTAAADIDFVNRARVGATSRRDAARAPPSARPPAVGRCACAPASSTRPAAPTASHRTRRRTR